MVIIQFLELHSTLISCGVQSYMTALVTGCCKWIQLHPQHTFCTQIRQVWWTVCSITYSEACHSIYSHGLLGQNTLMLLILLLLPWLLQVKIFAMWNTLVASTSTSTNQESTWKMAFTIMQRLWNNVQFIIKTQDYLPHFNIHMGIIIL